MIKFYLVKTDRTNPKHHGLRENTSSHVLTCEPQPGDLVEYLLYSDIGATSGVVSFFSNLPKSSSDTGLKITTHPGRRASLGEDGLEDAFGNPAIDLLLEYLNGASWKYAPVEVEPCPSDECLQFQLKKIDGCWKVKA